MKIDTINALSGSEQPERIRTLKFNKINELQKNALAQIYALMKTYTVISMH